MLNYQMIFNWWTQLEVFRIQWVHLKESERGTTGRLSGQAGAPLRKPAWTNCSSTCLKQMKQNQSSSSIVKYRQVSSSIVKSHPIQLIKIHQLMVHPILHNQCDPIQHQNSSTVRHPQLMSTVSTWASRGDPSQSAGVPGVLSVRGQEL